MTVYVDNMRLHAKVGRLDARWSHLMADSDEELIEFAKSIGLRPEWIQEPDKPYGPHFDVTESKRQQAIRMGAQEVDWRDMGKLLKKFRKNRLRTQQ